MVKSFREKAKQWTEENNLRGASAFSRYVMMVFVDCICRASSDFTFKGGNLLWLYIQTPRVTVDLDFATLLIDDHDAVRSTIAEACTLAPEGISFKVERFSQIVQQNQKGAAVIIGYRTDDGAANKFSLDIVYKVPTIVDSIPSPVGGRKITAASIENIIADKLATCHRFKSGNTRMKDYDDLWRISKSSQQVDARILKETFDTRNISALIPLEWVDSESEKIWSSHAARYPDLPRLLKVLISDVNSWISFPAAFLN